MFGGGKEFGESSAIHQTKPSKLVVTINTLSANLSICQTFFAKIFIHPLLPNFPTTQYIVHTFYMYSWQRLLIGDDNTEDCILYMALTTDQGIQWPQ